jgi:hypothetical protein
MYTIIEKEKDVNTIFKNILNESPEDDDTEESLEEYIRRVFGDNKQTQNILNLPTIINDANICYNIYELQNIITDILIKYSFNLEEAREMSIDIIWNERIWDLFALNYINFDFMNITSKFAEQFYYQSCGLRNGRPYYCSEKTDYFCAQEILNTKKITDSIIKLGKYIYIYFYWCQKAAYHLNTSIKLNNNKTVWFMIKNMIKALKLADFDKEFDLFIKIISIIENYSTPKFEIKNLTNLANNKLFKTNLKKLLIIQQGNYNYLIK